MSLIIDGMDQKKTNIPAPLFGSKSTDGLKHLQTHVVGVLANGHGAMLFWEMKQFGKGPDLAISNICRALHVMTDKYSNDKSRWPDVLYLQMDNAASENKNHWIFRLAGLLVHFGIFKKVSYFFCAIYILVGKFSYQTSVLLNFQHY